MREGFNFPGYHIDLVDRSGKKVRLKQDWLRLIKEVELEQVWDGADMLTLTFTDWDELEAKWVIMGGKIFDPGNELILRAFYGGKSTTMGKFTIDTHKPQFEEGPPTLSVIAYDGFARLMDNTFPGDYGGQKASKKKGGKVTTYTDVMKVVARKYGYGLAADVSPRIKFKKKTVRRRKRKNGKVVKNAKGKAVRYKKKISSRIVKNAGDTDAKMVKDMANYSGFLQPKVRFVDGRDVAQVQRLHEVTENLRERDVLFFRRANIRRQLEEANTFELRYHTDREYATLKSFNPTWKTDDTPIAVRVSGMVRTTVGKKKKRVRKRIMIVEAQLTEPQQLRERNALLRQADRLKRSDPTKAAKLRDRASRIQPKISITKEITAKPTKKDRKRFKNVGSAMIEILDKDLRPVKEYDRIEKRKVQTMRRETLKATFVVTNGEELRQIAKGWLAARLATHMTATAMTVNLQGSETFYPNQVHQVVGLPVEYEGPYMIRKATHVWAEQMGHACSMDLQKVAEVPSSLTSRETTVE